MTRADAIGWVGPLLTIVPSISELGAQKTTTTSGYSPSGGQFIPAPGLLFSHISTEVGQDQRERRQRGDVVDSGLAVVLPPGEAAVQEPDRQRDPVDGLRLRQM